MPWSSDPEDLATAGIDYRISVIAGEDMLAERIALHRDHKTQQVAITWTALRIREGNEKFDAVVEVAAVGLEHAAPVMASRSPSSLARRSSN
ncbi:MULTISPECIES: hypothetical protein [Sinorhizobium]|uniref:hypothetical protein n=1 Tax=Sinorhizobium TaxID=28105 RepID=UPI0024B1D98E|nr:hypothetical protein [Sinorhizobium terangae]WFU51914.1 hypothetical protein QA637_28815 [Sinorhizobium terangae]